MTVLSSFLDNNTRGCHRTEICNAVLGRTQRYDGQGQQIALFFRITQRNSSILTFPKQHSHRRKARQKVFPKNFLKKEGKLVSGFGNRPYGMLEKDVDRWQGEAGRA
jgi:hypothetical protein